MKKIQIITLFPEMFHGILTSSIIARAQKKGLVEFEIIDLRYFGLGKRHQVDDTPYGGDDGMLLMIEPLYNAILSAKKTNSDAKVILLTPRGKLWKQSMAQKLSDDIDDLILVCCHYEGYDERIVRYIDYQVSIGNYVLTGGEIPALVLIDSIVRLIPGALGNDNSAKNESFSDDKTLEYPQYTKPAEFMGNKVPDILISGNHELIDKWREEHKI